MMMFYIGFAMFSTVILGVMLSLAYVLQGTWLKAFAMTGATVVILVWTYLSAVLMSIGSR